MAIRASRVERDTATLLATTLRRLAEAVDGEGAVGEGADAEAAADGDAIDALVEAATADLGHDDDSGLWRLAFCREYVVGSGASVRGFASERRSS